MSAMEDKFKSAHSAAQSALRWAERREERLTAMLAKKMALDGVPLTEIAGRLDLTIRQARKVVASSLAPTAVIAGQPLDRLAAVQTAIDEVVQYASGLDVDELWDWARIFDVENGRAHSFGIWEPDDNVTQALADVRLYSRRLREPGIDDEARCEAERKRRLAQCRARVFGADEDTIAVGLAAS